MSMLDVTHLIESGGLLLIAGIIFAESGLLAGFFLPGDTLLFTAGFFVAQGKLPALIWVIPIVVIAALAGYEVGYHIGHRFGKRLFRKKDGLIFRQEYLTKSEQFYEKHGGKTIMLSRFIPIVRTFAPVVAGIGDMRRGRFTFFNAAGAIVWVTIVIILGDLLGSRIPNIDHYLLPIILLAMVFSFGPSVYHLAKDPKIRHRLTGKPAGKKID